MNTADIATVRQHLNSVLGSRTLIQADRLRRFLKYIVNYTLSGRTDRLKQFSIAIDVFDRDESFDPAIDAIVRVEAGRIRFSNWRMLFRARALLSRRGIIAEQHQCESYLLTFLFVSGCDFELA